MKNKLKYLNFEYDFIIKDFDLHYEIVNNPTIYSSNLPNGEYLIRGDKKNHSKEYYHYNGKWWLIRETTEDKDKRNYYFDAFRFNLYPNLSEKEWELLNKCKNKLSPYWKRAIEGRNLFMEFRKNNRGMEKRFFKLKKNIL